MNTQPETTSINSNNTLPSKNISYAAGTGHIDTMTADQKEGLSILKDYIKQQAFYKDSRHTDAYLLRFLRARKFNLQLTYEMLNKCELWRKEKDVDNLVKTFQLPYEQKVSQNYPRFYHKTDKYGHPVYIELLGKMNIHNLCDILAPNQPDKTKKQEETLKLMLDHMVVGYEHLENVIFPQCSKKADKHIDQCCNILDLKGVGVSQATSVLPFIRETARVSQDYYPEMMYKMYILNMPFLLRSVWSLIKGFLDPVTVSKIVILGGSYKKELCLEIEENNIPDMFEGKCKCPEGCENSNAGPWNDKEVNTLSN